MSDKPAEWGSDPAVSSSSRIEQQGYGEIDKLRWQVETLTAALREAEVTRAQLRETLLEGVRCWIYDSPPCPEGPQCDHCGRYKQWAVDAKRLVGWDDSIGEVALADPPPGGTEKGSADGE